MQWKYHEMISRMSVIDAHVSCLGWANTQRHNVFNCCYWSWNRYQAENETNIRQLYESKTLSVHITYDGNRVRPNSWLHAVMDGTGRIKIHRQHSWVYDNVTFYTNAFKSEVDTYKYYSLIIYLWPLISSHNECYYYCCCCYYCNYYVFSQSLVPWTYVWLNSWKCPCLNKQMLCCAVLCCAVLCCAVLCCAMLCHVMSCHVMSCRTVDSLSVEFWL